MNNSIKVFSSANLKEGAKIVLDNKLHIYDGVIESHCKSLLYRNPDLGNTIFVYYLNDKPIASAYCFRYINQKRIQFHVFVSKPNRRKGIGTQLIKFAKKHLKVDSFLVEPWDERSTCFYDSVCPARKISAVAASFA